MTTHINATLNNETVGIPFGTIPATVDEAHERFLKVCSDLSFFSCSESDVADVLVRLLVDRDCMMTVLALYHGPLPSDIDTWARLDHGVLRGSGRRG